MVRIEHLAYGYGDEMLVEDLSFEARAGEITMIASPSGFGKTTLLKTINRLHEVEDVPFWHRGQVAVLWDGVMQDVYDEKMDVKALRRRVAYIFQSPAVLPMSIEANVAFGLRLAEERDGVRMAQKVRAALEAVGLYDEVHARLDAPASILSQGQKQRLAIARALVLDPKILLFDEPTSSLDPEATLRIEALVRQLKKDRTILWVTHDTAQTERIGDQVVSLGE